MRGFTLLELMVVLAIIIILFVGSFHGYKIYLDRIDTQKVKLTLYSVAEALIDFFQEKGSFEHAILSEFKIYPKIIKHSNFHYEITKKKLDSFEICATANNVSTSHFLTCKKICLKDTGEFNCSC